MCILCQSKFLILVKSPGIKQAKVLENKKNVLERPGIWIVFFCGNPVGVLIDSHLTLKNHIDDLTKKYPEESVPYINYGTMSQEKS